MYSRVAEQKETERTEDEQKETKVTKNGLADLAVLGSAEAASGLLFESALFPLFRPVEKARPRRLLKDARGYSTIISPFMTIQWPGKVQT
jgi:hypothetical protein